MVRSRSLIREFSGSVPGVPGGSVYTIVTCRQPRIQHHPSTPSAQYEFIDYGSRDRRLRRHSITGLPTAATVAATKKIHGGGCLHCYTIAAIMGGWADGGNAPEVGYPV
jgi:hypothetical protein